MANNSYVRGSNFERQIQKKLEAQNYYVMRSAGSHTVVDVMAIKADSILLIQCKTSNKETIPDLKQLLKSFETMSNGVEAKTNIKLFEELKVPFVAGIVLEDMNFCPDGVTETKKRIIWKGVGRNNLREFEWTGTRWIQL